MRIFDDFTRPGFWQAPFTTFTRCFDDGQRVQASPDGGVAVLGYHVLRAIGMHPHIDGTPMGPPGANEPRRVNEILRHGLFAQVSPDHRRMRSAVLAGLNGTAVREVGPQVRALAERRVASLDDRPCDLFTDICLPLAADAWALFLGHDPADAPPLAEAVETFSRQISFSPDPTTADEADRAAAWILDRTHAAAAVPGDLPIHRMVAALGEDPRGVPLVASLLFNAIDTAAAGLAGTVAILLHEVPESDLLLDATFRELAIEEALRLATPAVFTVRQAREEVVFPEIVIPRGAMVWMWWSAGNCDPHAFPDPLLFRPGRAHRGLPFGIGPHSCVGHGWTKQLAHILIGAGLTGRRRLHPLSTAIDWTIGGARRPHRQMVVHR